MMSTESQTQNQQQQSTIYDERVYNDRMRQIFNSIDSASISHSPLSSNDEIGQITSIVDFLFPEEANIHQQQQHHYRPSPVTRPRFTSSTIRLQSAATTAMPNNSSTNNLHRLSSSSSLSANNTTEYQPRFASRLSSTRLPMVPPPVGSHDQIAGHNTNIDPIAPPSAASTVGVMGQPSSASAVLARSTSTTNGQPQQFVTMTQTTTTTFCYVPASGSLAYNNLPGANRSAAVPHQ